MSSIINAAPMVIDQGTRDLSIRVVPGTPLSIPQHLPKVYVFAEKGPVGPTYMDFGQASLTQVYGDDTFNVNKKYFTHQTNYLQALGAAANNCVVHRVVAPDARDTANITLCLDILETQVPLYVKNTDGSLQLDALGNPVAQKDSNGLDMTIAGFNVAWVTKVTQAPVGTYQRGLQTVEAGLQGGAGAGRSVSYPIFEFAADSPGEAGNRLAVRLFPALESDIVPFPSHILREGKKYPYNFSLVKIADQITGKTNVVLNSFGAQSARFITEDNGIDPASGAIIDFEKVIGDQYLDLPVAQSTGLGTAFVYQSNLDTVLEMLYNREMVISDPHRDEVINNSEVNHHALNILTLTSSNGSPYQAIKLIDVQGSIRLTRNTNVFLSGSSDGTITEALLDSLFIADMDNYNNSLHEYNDLVLHPESIIYDSGFSLAAKKAMPKFISRRKDTSIVLSTFAHNAPSATLAEQFSVGVALKSMIELYPESSTFGTPVMRATLVGGAADIINSLYTKRVPLTYELLNKSARFMGASNGAWRNGFAFDRAPNSIVTFMKNPDVSWVPASTRNTLWSVGLNFVLNYEINRQFFPAIQTVYENDTSVLNSFFTTVAISYLNKVAHAAWREFSGSISLTNAQLEEQVNLFVSNQVRDKFDGKFVVVPNATVTELDNLKGFSWTLPITIYANNSKTVMSTFVEARRMTDLAE